jgi:hypothetical protein
MSLPPRTSDDWSAEIGALAEEEMKATIVFYEPGSGGVFDPVTDTRTGGTPEALLFRTKARVQHFRSTTDQYDLNQWSNQVNVRLQLPLSAGNGYFIRKGLIVRVEACEKFPQLLSIALQVESAINSSSAALQTVNCVTALVETPASSVVP